MRKTIFGLGVVSLAALLCVSCEHDVENGRQIAVCPTNEGIVGLGISAPLEEESPVVFTDENIEWFNAGTREIKFQNLDPVADFARYREIAFRLDGETLFTAATIVSDVNSQLYYDLVLYYSDPVEPRYYLQDAYPLWAADTDQSRANAEARAEGWSKFLEHLRLDNRLR